MGKTRDLFNKIRDTKGIFHAKMGLIQDRSGMDLTEAKILRRGGKNTWKNCTKKDLHDQYNHDGVITHLEPDILECEVRWTQETKLVEVMEIVELFQILKDDAVKVLHSI